MLQKAKKKTLDKGLEITWVEQDCSRLSLDLKSPFIYMTGNSFQHFLANNSQRMLLKAVYQHLTPGGIFIFGTRFPSLIELLSSDGKVEYEGSSYDALNRRVDSYSFEEYDPITQIQHCTSVRRINDSTGPIEEKESISLRYVFPQEMKQLLEASGFKIVRVYGSWNKEELSTKSGEMICICERPLSANK